MRSVIEYILRPLFVRIRVCSDKAGAVSELDYLKIQDQLAQRGSSAIDAKQILKIFAEVLRTRVRRFQNSCFAGFERDLRWLRVDLELIRPGAKIHIES